MRRRRRRRRPALLTLRCRVHGVDHAPEGRQLREVARRRRLVERGVARQAPEVTREVAPRDRPPGRPLPRVVHGKVGDARRDGGVEGRKGAVLGSLKSQERRQDLRHRGEAIERRGGRGRKRRADGSAVSTGRKRKVAVGHCMRAVSGINHDSQTSKNHPLSYWTDGAVPASIANRRLVSQAATAEASAGGTWSLGKGSGTGRGGHVGSSLGRSRNEYRDPAAPRIPITARTTENICAPS